MARIQLENVYNVLSVMPSTEQVSHEQQLTKLLKDKPFFLEGRKGLASYLEALTLHICLHSSLLCGLFQVIVICIASLQPTVSPSQCFSNFTMHISPGGRYRVSGL